jgi:hypothetical protein
LDGAECRGDGFAGSLGNTASLMKKSIRKDIRIDEMGNLRKVDENGNGVLVLLDYMLLIQATKQRMRG